MNKIIKVENKSIDNAYQPKTIAEIHREREGKVAEITLEFQEAFYKVRISKKLCIRGISIFIYKISYLKCALLTTF